MSDDQTDVLRASVDKFFFCVEKFVVTTGDLVERHPVLFWTLLFYAITSLIPEAWILHSLFGFGPSGPVKGSPAALVQRIFWDATVKKDSWFSTLQCAGMKGTSARQMIGSIAAKL
ncbi:uncharacterized protein PHACADRAFT_263205 [Phanerochaete carnosa HHB-10118-sp]|uniref:Uncharacterized protein n=1 Tax=Phanerochaete carnosa (strain HHB-10118-sp) TaxID=650164 RepID=K5VX64_PHACS|nr:uncharacterized protein PHACADRAFT_263205 [Phanerochaete carnosa HHB-10118-sp]EKM51194.1 hypothetical protein PHACADRAFT_263205 [Phanerochaete carnosa HHB-10118-sp]